MMVYDFFTRKPKLTFYESHSIAVARYEVLERYITKHAGNLCKEFTISVVKLEPPLRYKNQGLKRTIEFVTVLRHQNNQLLYNNKQHNNNPIVYNIYNNDKQDLDGTSEELLLNTQNNQEILCYSRNQDNNSNCHYYLGKNVPKIIQNIYRVTNLDTLRLMIIDPHPQKDIIFVVTIGFLEHDSNCEIDSQIKILKSIAKIIEG
jgi:hypothetical protein